VLKLWNESWRGTKKCEDIKPLDVVVVNALFRAAPRLVPKLQHAASIPELQFAVDVFMGPSEASNWNHHNVPGNNFGASRFALMIQSVLKKLSACFQIWIKA
jgi:hypothetical protein